MSIIDNVLARIGYFKTPSNIRPPSEFLTVADAYRWETPSAFTPEKQAALYAALTWIATAIDRTAEIAAGGVFSVKRVAGEPGGGDDEDLPNHPFEVLLRRPNPMQSGAEFMRDWFSWMKVSGNTYVYLNAPAEGTPPDELWLVPSSMMQPIPDGRSFIRGYKFEAPGQPPEFVEPWKIIHTKTFNPLNPFVGLSPIQSLALDSYGDLAQQKWNLGLFDKNAGKFPGILAFKHMVEDNEWERMKKTRDEQWGGAKHAQIMMLRGVGDTVQWLPAALSQREMEFLAGRTFTKEEIYGKLAPGLASILAVNATEANAIAGKSTLIEFGVWPLLVQLAQKLTAEVLPLYGAGLLGEFDDMRQANRILDMQEQEAYERTHTINEIRLEYYGDGPMLLDESQVARLEEEAAVGEESKEMAIQAMQKPEETGRNRKKPATSGKAAMPQVDSKPSKELDPRGFLLPAQVGPATALPGDTSKPTAPAMPPPPPPQVVPGQDAPDKEPPAKAELEAWEKFALKRLSAGEGRQGHDFEPNHIGWRTAERIRGALKAAQTTDQIRAVFTREHSAQASDVARLADAIEAAASKL